MSSRDQPKPNFSLLSLRHLDPKILATKNVFFLYKNKTCYRVCFCFEAQVGHHFNKRHHNSYTELIYIINVN